ncbi:MAG: ankyrin repeat domain-containing protein [Pirellulaceae bacterium]
MITSNRRLFLATAIASGSAATLKAAVPQDSQSQDDSATKKSKPEPAEPEKPKPIEAKLVQQFVGASHGNLKAVKELVEKHPRIVHSAWDWAEGDFETGLGAASHVGNREIAEFLLERDARIDIFAMTMLGFAKQVKAVLSAFPDTPRVPGPHGIPLLSHAIYGKKQALEVFELLLQSGADVDQTSYGGQTPLMAAASLDAVEVAEQLIAQGADMEAKDARGDTALVVAEKRKSKMVIELLKRKLSQS